MNNKQQTKNMPVKKGDVVVVITGQDKGKKGRILKAFPKNNKIIVEKVHFTKRHSKPTQQNQKGGIIEKEAPIDVSNVALFNERIGEVTRAVYKISGDTRVRVCKKTGDELS